MNVRSLEDLNVEGEKKRFLAQRGRDGRNQSLNKKTKKNASLGRVGGKKNEQMYFNKNKNLNIEIRENIQGKTGKGLLNTLVKNPSSHIAASS